MRKCSETTLVNNADLFSYADDADVDIVATSIPTRHSKSLDQLQMCSKNNFHYSLGSILSRSDCCSNNGHSDGSNFYRKKKDELKNVASENNMRNIYMVDDDILDKSTNDNMKCSCSNTIFNKTSTVSKKASHRLSYNEDLLLIDAQHHRHYPDDDAQQQELLLDKRFTIKNLTNIKEQIVKSLSQTTSTDSTQNIFRSNSMQFFSPSKKRNSLVTANGVNTNISEPKFNSLLSTKRINQNYNNSSKSSSNKIIHHDHDQFLSIELLNDNKQSLILDSISDIKSSKDNNKHINNQIKSNLETKSKRRPTENGTINHNNNKQRHFDIGSPNSSTDESLSIYKNNKKTGLLLVNRESSSSSSSMVALLIGAGLSNSMVQRNGDGGEIRKVRSTSCIDAIESFSAAAVLSGTESLPNITNTAPAKSDRLHYPEMKYYNSSSNSNSTSSSSTTSEQSGWITSRSSSVASSIVDINTYPAATSAPHFIEKKLFNSLASETRRSIRKYDKRLKNDSLFKFNRSNNSKSNFNNNSSDYRKSNRNDKGL